MRSTIKLRVEHAVGEGELLLFLFDVIGLLAYWINLLVYLRQDLLVYCLCFFLGATGNLIFGKQVEKRGNVLIVAAEETQNEMDIRLTACKQQMGKNDKNIKFTKDFVENNKDIDGVIHFAASKAVEASSSKIISLSSSIKGFIFSSKSLCSSSRNVPAAFSPTYTFGSKLTPGTRDTM